jgi:2-C-methyl-D-erythritol 4-phosphate cytidylyltransferase
MKTVAVVLASGSGQRFEAKNLPKHLTPVLEIPVLIWTLDTIFKSELFSSVIVVTREKDLISTQKLVKEYKLYGSESIRFTIGSNDRTQSFILGFNDLKNCNLVDSKSIVALFDANRPLTSQEQLLSLHDKAYQIGCSCPARPVINGVAMFEHGRITKVPDKNKFVEFVTPEFINLDFFDDKKSCFMKGYNCFVEFALDMNCKPATIDATSLNSKLTYPEDKTFLEGLAIDNSVLKPRKR